MFLSMLIFGASGVVVLAANHSGYITLDENNLSNGIFLLIAKLPKWYLYIIVFMVVGLVTSTVDTIQTGLTAIVAAELVKRDLHLNWARVFSLIVSLL